MLGGGVLSRAGGAGGAGPVSVRGPNGEEGGESGFTRLNAPGSGTFSPGQFKGVPGASAPGSGFGSGGGAGGPLLGLRSSSIAPGGNLPPGGPGGEGGDALRNSAVPRGSAQSQADVAKKKSQVHFG